MYKNHIETINKLKNHYEKDNRIIAFIIVGSVARDDCFDENADIDFYLVVNDELFKNYYKNNNTAVSTNDFCVTPCAEANGFYITKKILKKIHCEGNELTRWGFFKATIIFSSDEEIVDIINKISIYPGKEQQNRMVCFYSQIYYHFSFFEFAYYSKTKYLIYETATKFIFFIGRLILADNKSLYPGRKYFFRELSKQKMMPPNIVDDLLFFLDNPNIEQGKKIINKLNTYKEYPKPNEGIKNNIIRNSFWNWLDGNYSIDEW